MNRSQNNFFLSGLTIFLLSLIFSPGIFAQDDYQQDTITKAFYDTLRVRAEKNRVTRVLYDIVVIKPPSGSRLRENLSSTKPFDKYSGLIIRKCDIIRLNAFGTNIDDPAFNNPSGAEKVLNSTYLKTRNFILTKYLLFKPGDTISPLQMSDNERLLRELSFVEDARVIIIPTADSIADVIVVIRETYPLGFEVHFDDFDAGKLTLFDRNFGGLGHELDIAIPYSFDKYPYPGIGTRYVIRNIAHSFSNLEMNFSDGLGTTKIGGSFSRSFISSETKYAWSATARLISTTEDLDTMAVPVPLRYTYQDYWLSRSFMLSRERVTRLIFSARYINNNVFKRPEIDHFSFYRLQRYQLFLGSIALSAQKFVNTSLIYSYGRTEDIPYGYLLEIDGGREINEFKGRTYLGTKAAYGNFVDAIGYMYGGIGFSTFYNHGKTEQGMFQASLRYFSPLIHSGNSRIRAFVSINYTRGFNRYFDEFLYLRNTDLIRGFRNDSINGNHRIVVNLEPVLFTPKPVYGFRFAFFAFADAGFLVKGRLYGGEYNNVTGYGIGVRIRNDQLVLNTVQIRFGIYPDKPPYSDTSWGALNGLVRLKPTDFEPGPPGVIPYR